MCSKNNRQRKIYLLLGFLDVRLAPFVRVKDISIHVLRGARATAVTAFIVPFLLVSFPHYYYFVKYVHMNAAAGERVYCVHVQWDRLEFPSRSMASERPSAHIVSCARAHTTHTHTLTL